MTWERAHDKQLNAKANYKMLSIKYDSYKNTQAERKQTNMGDGRLESKY